MAAPPSDPAAAAAPKAPRLPPQLATEMDPDIDPGFPDVEGVDLSGAHLHFPDARTLSVLRARLARCTIDEDTEATLDVVDAVLEDVDLTGRPIESLTRTRLVRCRLGGTDLGGATLTDVDIDGCVLDLASMRGARLERVRVNGGRVEGLDLSGATVEDAVLEDLSLGEVGLDGTRFRRVDLTGADLSGVVDMTAIRGATISESQAVALSVRLAGAAGMIVARS